MLRHDLRSSDVSRRRKGVHILHSLVIDESPAQVQTVCDSDTVESLLLGMFESLEPAVFNNTQETVYRAEATAFLGYVLRFIPTDGVEPILDVLKLLFEHGLADYLEESHRLKYQDSRYPKSLRDTVEGILASNDHKMSALQTVQACAFLCDRTLGLGLLDERAPSESSD